MQPKFFSIMSAAVLSIGVFVYQSSAEQLALSGITDCTVTFSLSSGEKLSVVQFLADYSDVQGTFVGSGSSVECNSLVESATIAAEDLCYGPYEECQWGAGRVLSVVLMHPQGLPTNGAVAACRFQSVEGVSRTAIAAEVVDASLPVSFMPPESKPGGVKVVAA